MQWLYVWWQSWGRPAEVESARDQDRSSNEYDAIRTAASTGSQQQPSNLMTYTNTRGHAFPGKTGPSLLLPHLFSKVAYAIAGSLWHAQCADESGAH